jgi:hypothetical protein
MTHGNYLIVVGEKAWDDSRQSEARQCWLIAKTVFDAAAAAADSAAANSEAQCGIMLVTAYLANFATEPTDLAKQAIELGGRVIDELKAAGGISPIRLAAVYSLMMKLCYGNWFGCPWEPDSEQARFYRLEAIKLFEADNSKTGRKAYRRFLLDAALALMSSPYTNDRALGESYLQDARRSARKDWHLADFVLALKALRRLHRNSAPAQTDE